MGKSNAAVKNWISVKERFADFYNGTVFDGRQVVRAEELHRYRDVIMRWNQEKVHYAMPVRNI